MEVKTNENPTIAENETDHKAKTPRVDFGVQIEVGNDTESVKKTLNGDLSVESHKEIESMAKRVALLLYLMLLELRNPDPITQMLTLTVSCGKVRHNFTYSLSVLDFSAYKRLGGIHFDMNTKLLRTIRIWLHGTYVVAALAMQEAG